jgi:hypothetical protein
MVAAKAGESVSQWQSFYALDQQANRHRTEAEPEVLADYVAELFAGEGTPAEIKRASIEQLSDFLEDCA